MIDLPAGWAYATLGELAYFRKGKKPDTFGDKLGDGFVAYLDILAVERGIVERYAKAEQSRLLEEGEVLVVWDGARSGWAGLAESGAVGSTLLALKAIGIERRYLYYFLTSKFEYINSNTRGTGIPHVDPGVFWALEVPVAPNGEQHRITRKIDELISKSQACQKRLERIPILLKRFRQSVLAAACSGRLTADWREQNVTCGRKARASSGGQYQIAQPVASLPKLPNTWEWLALGNYASCSRGRFSVRPRNDPRYFGGAHPFIQIGDLPSDGGWVTSHTQTLNERGSAVSKKFPRATVAIAIVGATIANTGLLAYDMFFTDSMVGIQTSSFEGNRYVELYLRSKKHQIRQTSYSSGGQPNIKLGLLNQLPLPLPPPEELQEVVCRVDRLFDLADEIEARYKKATGQVDKLIPSILGRAFRGELVPQDPNDEPAEKLLERIRAARASELTPAVRKKRPSPPKRETNRKQQKANRK